MVSGSDYSDDKYTAVTRVALTLSPKWSMKTT